MDSQRNDNLHFSRSAARNSVLICHDGISREHFPNPKSVKMKKRKFDSIRYSAIFFILFLANYLIAETYYVDATNGNDGNVGTSELLAWKTISHVMSQAVNFQPGDFILFKKGEVWNGERLYSPNHPSGTINSPITYGAFGTGDKPVINIHVNQNPNWTDEGNNIWSAEIGTGARFFKNGTEMLRTVDLSNLGLYGTEYHTELINGGNNLKLSIYSTINPSANTYAWSKFSSVISLPDADYIDLVGIDFQGGAGPTIRVFDNVGWNIMNCTVGKNAADGIKIKNSSSILIDHAYLDAHNTIDQSLLANTNVGKYSGCEDGIFVTTGSTAITVQYCYFKNWGHASFSANTDDATKVISNIIFHNNELTSPDILYGGRLAYSGYSEDGAYFNNHIHDISVQNQLGGSRNHFHHNIIDGVLDSPLKIDKIGVGIKLSNYNIQVVDNIIENNVIANTDGIGILIYSINFELPGEVSGNIIRNNIIFNCGITDGDIGIQFHEDESNQSIFNNTVQNNLIYSANTTQTCLYQYNGTVSSVALFNTQHVDIEENIAGNPLFVDAANGDFHLAENSPAIDAGTASLSTTDYDGNAIPIGAVDIGAYEYQSPLSVDYLLPLQAILQGNNVLLKWISAHEQDNNSFKIERSANGSNWQIIAQVEGAENSVSFKHYQVSDKLPSCGKWYYRLKQMDYNARHSYSNIVSVSLNCSEIKMYPNPTAGKLFIFDNSLKEEYVIFSQEGKVVQRGQILANKIDLTLLKAGTYFVKIGYSESSKLNLFQIVKK